MMKDVADTVLETRIPQRHILTCVVAVSSSPEGRRHVPDAAHKKSLSIPVSRPGTSLFKGPSGRIHKDVVS
jgi:hypothetical protein